MYKHILMPTDFGEPAARAQQYAVDMAQQVGARLTLLHVHGVPTAFHADREKWPLAELGQAAQAALERAVGEIRRVHTATEGRIEVGDPRERILAFAEQAGADLIVIGTHGRTGLSHLILGSVAERVVRTSRVPVLTVRFDKHAPVS